jgi:hypothetical protein
MKKKLVTLFTATILAMSLASPVMAAEDTSYTDSQPHTQSMTVTASLGSSYSVAIPAALELAYNESGSNYQGTYQVGAKGDILETSYVEIKPETSSFDLARVDSGSTKVSASVSQSKTKWYGSADKQGSELLISNDDYVYTNGTVTAALTENGLYSGNVSFTFGLKSAN